MNLFESFPSLRDAFSFFLALIYFSGAVGLCLWVISRIPLTTRIFDWGHFLIKSRKDNFFPEFLVFKQALVFLVLVERLAQITSFLRQISFFLLIRAGTMWITVLPCLHPVGKIVPFGGIFGGFNDYLPLSGHMAFSHLLSWYISERTGPPIFLFDLLLGYSMIAMRRHYTIELISSVLAIQAIVRLIP